MLAKVLSLVGHAAPPPVSGSLVTAATASDARQRLRAAQWGLLRAEVALGEARAATARAHDAVGATAEAEEALKVAEAAAEAASAQWAADGAHGELPAEAQRLLEAATLARTRAYHANLKAKGAGTALSRSEFDGAARGAILATERDAAIACDQARDAVGTAAGEVMFAEVAAPALARAEQLRAALDVEIDTLLAIWQPNRMARTVHAFAGGAHELGAELARLATHAEAVKQLGRDNTVARPSEQRAAEAALSAWGERLLADPEATLA